MTNPIEKIRGIDLNDEQIARRKAKVISSIEIVLSNPLAKIGLILLVIILFTALFGPYLAPNDPHERQLADDGSWKDGMGPSTEYPLGTTTDAYPIFSQLLYGARIALMAGGLTAIIVGLVGSTVGVTAGYYGGTIENGLMRLADLAYGIPFLPFAIVLVIVLGSSIWNIIIAISVLLWRDTARVVRSEVITIKEQKMIDAARASGASHRRIIIHHIFPKVLPTIILYAVFAIGWAILAEAGLSFLGLGDPDSLSWGVMLQQAYASQALERGMWFWIVPPGLFISMTVVSAYLIAQGIEDLANPKLRRR